MRQVVIEITAFHKFFSADFTCFIVLNYFHRNKIVKFSHILTWPVLALYLSIAPPLLL